MAPADLRGRYNGVCSLAFGTRQTLAPIVGGTMLAVACAATLSRRVRGGRGAGHLALGAARRARMASPHRARPSKE